MITIIEGCGSNIASLIFALKRIGEEVQLTSNPELIQKAEKVILPGVGSASRAMQTLQDKQLTKLIPQLVQPVLGICLGMQLLYEFSEEGNTNCLGIIDGSVCKIPKDEVSIVPHMGWNQLERQQNSPLIEGINPAGYMYFIHSYSAPINEYTITSTEYGNAFTSLVQKNNFYGAQFHPEKSGILGLKLLENFARLSS